MNETVFVALGIVAIIIILALHVLSDLYWASRQPHTYRVERSRVAETSDTDPREERKRREYADE